MVDIINGVFEICGAVWMIPDVLRVRQDKCVRGVYWPARIFFLLWGCWNCFFYPYYDHWWSFWGGVAMTVVNCTWLVHVVWYELRASNEYTRG